MRIETVKIKQFKILKDFEANINGNNIFLLGENGVGKSSILQFIRIALGETAIIPPDTDGKGTVIATKDGKQLVFKVKMHEGRSIIEVEYDGATETRKGKLAELIGAIDFNIDAFVEMSKSKKGQKEQVDIFKSFLPQDVRLELGQMEARIKIDYDERTNINREKERLEKLIASHPFMDTNLNQFIKVDVQALLTRKEEIKKKLNNEYLMAKATNDSLRKAHQTKCDKIREEVINHNKNSDAAQANYEVSVECWDTLYKMGYRGNEVEEFCKNLKSNIKQLRIYEAPPEPEYINEIPSDELIKAIDLEIAGANEANEKHRKAEELKNLRKQLEEQITLSGDLTAKIDSSRQSISDAIKDMDSPVEGLSFNEDYLTYNGVPVSPDSLSTSEIIELGVRLKMAENKDLGVLFIERGESLGKERMKTILDIANKNNFQVIMEKVEYGTEKLKIQIIGE